MALISIIIPAFNEETRLPATLKEIRKFLTSKKIKAEVIVVDDGSTDNTVAAAVKLKWPALKVIKNPKNMGKGFSVKNGIQHASGSIMLFTDADLSTPIKHLIEFKKYAETGYGVVIASRDIPGSRVKVAQSHLRELGGKFFNLLVRLVAGLPLHDTQCGFKCFTRKAAAEIFSRQTINGFGFDVEVLYIAKKMGFKIMETPVEWTNSPATKVSFLKDSTRMFAELFKIRLNDLMGRYR